MANKISSGILAAAMSQSSGKSKKMCEDFIREFFRLASESLLEGESLKIKGFGTFKVSEVEGRTGVNVTTGSPQEIAPYKKVVFTPAKELASAINAPFENFESMEIEDELPEELFYPETHEDKISDENAVSTGILEAGSVEEGEDDDITYEAYSPEISPATDFQSKAESFEETAEEKVSTESFSSPVSSPSGTSSEPEEYEIPLPVYESEEKKSRFGMGFLVGALCTFAVCAVIFMLGCFFDWWPVNFGHVKEEIVAQELPVAPAEDSEEVAEPEVAPVYDTVSTTRYLTTIAREHYGDFNFWPYIYKENEAILGHPDRITPGTQVVVPPLSKYGVDPSNKDDVAAAKALGLEIYAKYK